MSNDQNTDLYKMYGDLNADIDAWEEERRVLEEYRPKRDGMSWDDKNNEDYETFFTSEDIAKKELEDEKDGIRARVRDSGEIEESLHFKRYNKKRVHKYTKTEMDTIRKSCLSTIVHDYGEKDWYHMSDEYRKEHDYLSEISLKLATLRRTYRLPSKYIEAMRIVFEAWEILSKNNYIHTKEEFFEMVSKGHIVSSRIIMPKLKRLGTYNHDMIIKYVSNPEMDATDLDPVDKRYSYDDFFNDENEEESLHRLLSAEEVQYILDHRDNPETLKVSQIKPKHISGYDKRSGTKRRKKEKKRDHNIRKDLAEDLNAIQTSSHYRSYGSSFLITHSIFEPEKEVESFWDKLYYDGSWGDEDSLALLDMAIDKEISKQHPPGERYLTYGDKEIERFFAIMEENGMNTVELRRKMSYSDNKYNKIKESYTRKERKKQESNLLQRITKLNNKPKFKKMVRRAERALNEAQDEEKY